MKPANICSQHDRAAERTKFLAGLHIVNAEPAAFLEFLRSVKIEMQVPHFEQLFSLERS